MNISQFKKPSKEQLKKVAIAVLILSILYSLYGGFEGDSFDQDLAASQANQRVAPAAANTLDADHAEIRAQLQPLRYTTLSAEIPARIDKFKYREGDSFKKGDALILLDCVFQKAQLIKAKAAKEA